MIDVSSALIPTVHGRDLGLADIAHERLENVLERDDAEGPAISDVANDPHLCAVGLKGPEYLLLREIVRELRHRPARAFERDVRLLDRLTTHST